MDWTDAEGNVGFPETMPEGGKALTAVWKYPITAITPLQQTVYNVATKPALEEVAKVLPAGTTVTLYDGTTVAASLTWTSENAEDYNTREGDGDFKFLATLTTGEGNLLGDGVVAPTCILRVGPDYIYTVDQGTGAATITKCNLGTVEIIVPDQLDGHAVTAIGPSAFANMTELARLTLPVGLKTIGESAFSDCTALTSLMLQNGLETIDKGAFSGCAALTGLTLPAGLKTIGESAFSSCAELASLVIPDSVETFGAKALDKCDKLGAVTLSSSLATTLNSNNAYTNAAKTKVTLPKPITSIMVNASTLTMDCDYTVAAGSAITVNSGATLLLNAGKTLTNQGTITNAGTIIDLGTSTNNGEVKNAGTISTCGGNWKGTASLQEGKGSFVTDHVYDSGKCVYCSKAEEKEPEVTELTITYVGGPITKVYDKSRNVTTSFKRSDFTISGTLSDHGDVKISSKIRPSYDKPDVGKRTVTISFTLEGGDAALYTVNPITVSGEITPKTLTVTPQKDQKKIYGAADPSYFPGTQKGRLEGDTLTGKLAREPGENVGKYKYLVGTLTAGDNYTIEVVEDFFTIDSKSINSTDVGLVTIGNQRYTGKAIEPEITLRFGTLTLKKDVDFKAEFSDNTQPGMATVKLTGIGNYNGERKTTFRILSVTDGDSGSSGGSSGGGGGSNSSGGSSADYDDDSFDTEPEGDEESEEEEEDSTIGNLILDDVDYGKVLFNVNGDPQSFTAISDDTAEAGNRILTIVPDPIKDEVTGEDLYLEDGIREDYGTQHLRIGPALAQTLRSQGYTMIMIDMEMANLYISLADLPGEIVLQPQQSEAPADGEAEEPSEAETEIAPTVMKVAYYDICLEQVDSRIQRSLPAEPEAEGEEGEEAPDATEAPEAVAAPVVLTPEELKAQASEQKWAGMVKDSLSENVLMMPAYALAIGVVTEDQVIEAEAKAQEQADAQTQEGEEQQPEAIVPQPLPEGFFPKGMTLMLMPNDDVHEPLEGAQTLYLFVEEKPQDDAEGEAQDAAEPQPQDDAEPTQDSGDETGEPALPEFTETTGLSPVRFVDLDGIYYAQVIPQANGIYSIVAPEGWVSAADEDDGFEEDEFEDGDATDNSGSFASGFGSSFTVDANGQAVTD